MVKALTQILAETQPELARKVAQNYKQLNFDDVDHLPELDDDHIDEAALKEAGCRKQQLAIQDRTVHYSYRYEKNGKKVRARPLRDVSVNKKLWEKLRTTDRALLAVHEALIASMPEYKDTTPIRKMLAETIRTPKFFKLLLEHPSTTYGGRSIEKTPKINALAFAASQIRPWNDKKDPFVNWLGGSSVTSSGGQAGNYTSGLEDTHFQPGVVGSNFRSFVNYTYFASKHQEQKDFKTDYGFDNNTGKGLLVRPMKDRKDALPVFIYDAAPLQASERKLNETIDKMAGAYDRVLTLAGCGETSQLAEIQAYFSDWLARTDSTVTAYDVAVEAYDRFCRNP